MSEYLIGLSEHYPWLNNAFFYEILEKEYPNEKIMVKKVHIKPALKHGENYGSQMIRATVQFAKNNRKEDIQDMRFVIKALVINEAMAKMAKDYHIFDKETIIYQKIMPAVEKLLESVGDNTKISPK